MIKPELTYVINAWRENIKKRIKTDKTDKTLNINRILIFSCF